MLDFKNSYVHKSDNYLGRSITIFLLSISSFTSTMYESYGYALMGILGRISNQGVKRRMVLVVNFFECF